MAEGVAARHSAWQGEGFCEVSSVECRAERVVGGLRPPACGVGSRARVGGRWAQQPLARSASRGWRDRMGMHSAAAPTALHALGLEPSPCLEVASVHQLRPAMDPHLARCRAPSGSPSRPSRRSPRDLSTADHGKGSEAGGGSPESVRRGLKPCSGGWWLAPPSMSGTPWCFGGPPEKPHSAQHTARCAGWVGARVPSP